MKTRDTDKHADGTIESLRTVVHTIKEYALPELPLNEKGQMPFMRAIFESVIHEVEASIARQETDKETAGANERYIAAIPALCRGEVVPCALHVSQPITELRSRVEALESVCKRLLDRYDPDGEGCSDPGCGVEYTCGDCLQLGLDAHELLNPPANEATQERKGGE